MKHAITSGSMPSASLIAAALVPLGARPWTIVAACSCAVGESLPLTSEEKAGEGGRRREKAGDRTCAVGESLPLTSERMRGSTTPAATMASLEGASPIDESDQSAYLQSSGNQGVIQRQSRASPIDESDQSAYSCASTRPSFIH